MTALSKWDATYEKIIDLVNKISFRHGPEHLASRMKRSELCVPSVADWAVVCGKQSFKKLPGIFDIIARSDVETRRR